MIVSMTCRKNLFPVSILLVFAGYFYYKSFSSKGEQEEVSEVYSNIGEFQENKVFSTQDYSANEDSTTETKVSAVDDLGLKKTTDESYMKESLKEKGFEAVDENIDAIEATPEKKEPAAGITRTAEAHPLINKTSDEKIVNKDQEDKEGQEDQENQEDKELMAQNGINELKNKKDFQDVDPECVDTPVFYGGVKAKVCILPGETFIESHLKSDGAFEIETVNAIVKAMTVYKNATFLDCGSNIGMMSTVVAGMGRSVVSVDPLVQHLSYLRRSLELLGNQDNARLLNNAVSNETGKLYPYTKKSYNQAAIKMYTEEEIKKNNFTPTGPAVNVVTVMDILATIDAPTVVMKVDVESFECRAVTSDVAHGKSGHFIPFIIMEWTMLQVMPEYQDCIAWLYDGGYQPHHWVSFKQLTKEELLQVTPFWKKGNKVHDVIWLHNKANPKELKP